MKLNIYRLPTAVAVVVVALLVLCPPAPAVVLDRIVAVVNNDAITWLELYEVMRTEQASKLEGMSEDEQRSSLASVEAEYLDNLISRKLQLQEASKLGMDISEEELEATIQNIRTKYGFSLKEFKEAIENSGTAWNYYRTNLREQIIIRKIVEKEVTASIQDTSGVNSSEDEISYHLRQIFFNAERGEEGLREAVQVVYDALATGVEFESLAIRMSDGPNASSGGDIGIIEAASLSVEMRDALEGVAAGGVANPVMTSKGAHILKLVQKVSKAEKMQEERFQARYAEWLKQLRGKAQIDIRL